MSVEPKISAQDALARLKDGNKKFLTAKSPIGDVSPKIREKTAREGQFPYAVIVTCSDSRVVPESIFSAGIGELFIIRVAGFVVKEIELGSIEYAVDHLGTPLVVVLGHTQCGAVGTALIHHEVEGALKSIIDEITAAIGDETNPLEAVKLNVKNSCKVIAADKVPAKVIGAVYHIDSGEVEFLD
ncbi:MAG: carbonic anhydrase [Selenomonadaceae bacterium]|nr:carbonic anhydrase [Selenomonadaceae bacterium]